MSTAFTFSDTERVTVVAALENRIDHCRHELAHCRDSRLAAFWNGELESAKQAFQKVAPETYRKEGE